MRGPSTRAATPSVTPETTGNVPVSSGSGQDVPTRLEAIEYSLRGQGFSGDVSKRIAAGHRASTRSIYDSRWRIFCDWCSIQGKDPLTTTAPVVADFLTYLFEVKKLAVTSITGYRSMLTTTLREVAGTELSGNLHLTKLLASFSIERPRDRDPFPTWDLALVLSRLQRGPYEPLQSASMKFLSGKVAFLVALATAKRRSELRAFSKKILHHPNWKSVTLRPLPKFVAKTEVPGRPETRLQDVTIPSLRDFVDPDLAQDAVNCPVRAVKVYISRTQGLHGDRIEFFIPYKHGAISPAPATYSSGSRRRFGCL